jgi:hypothetical protein
MVSDAPASRLRADCGYVWKVDQARHGKRCAQVAEILSLADTLATTGTPPWGAGNRYRAKRKELRIDSKKCRSSASSLTVGEARKMM